MVVGVHAGRQIGVFRMVGGEALGHAAQSLVVVEPEVAARLSAAPARLPMSMMSLGIVLALNHLYNNWTIAGSMSGAYILAVAARIGPKMNTISSIADSSA